MIKNYNDLITKTYDLYLQGEFEKAYTLITNNKDIPQGNQGEIFNFRYSIAFRMNNEELGIKIFEEALYSQNLWYPETLLLNDPDLDILRKNPKFPEYLELCKKRSKQFRFSGKPKLIIELPKKEYLNKPQLLIAMHGNSQPHDIVKGYWPTEEYYKHIIAYPISSEQDYPNSHVWTDIDNGTKELVQHYNKLVAQYSVPHDNITIASFSASASIVLNAVVNELISVKTLIFYGPWLPNFDLLKERLAILKDKGLNIFISCGDKDIPCFPWANALSERLKSLNIDYTYKVIPDLAHNYPKDKEPLFDLITK